MAKKEKPERRESEPTPHHENHHADARRSHHARETKETASEDPQPTPLTVFTPPHPGMNTFRVLPQAFREYYGGAGSVLTVTTPPTHAANTVTTVAGTYEVDPTILEPPAMVVASLTQGGAVKATQNVAVAANGAYTTTFPASVCVAGTATATVASMAAPAKTFTTPAFTLT